MNNKDALVVISFGTSHMDTRKKTIEACENTIRKKFPGMDFYRAWTSRMIIKKLKKRDNEEIMYPDELLEKLYLDGYKNIYIQSLHLICGEEYHKLLDIIEKYRNKFDRVILGRPLLSNLKDYDDIAEFIKNVSKDDIKNKKSNEATVWMGHGTEHNAHSSYAALDYRAKREEVAAYIATVEGHPSLEDIIYFLKRDKIEKIHLRPFLLVAGDHAKNDMASDDKDSWKSILEREGFDVELHLEGIGEFEYIQNKFLKNLEEAMSEESKEVKNDIVKKAKFYGIGVGPGDSELLTIKAVKTLEKIDVLYVPQAKDGKKSTAQNIAQEYLKPSLKIKERHFPMNYNIEEKNLAWDSISSEIKNDVESGINVGFITLGDPMVYSTYVYLLERLIGKIEIETIAGINSFINISSSNNFPLAMDRESLAVVSCTDNYESISEVIDKFDSVVLMKVYKNFREIIEMIENKNLENYFIMVSNSSMDSELVYRDIKEIKNLDKVPYFTTILLNKKWKNL
ncbi:MAG: cobalt-factor II C(20)-methyltransferase [Peptostreptococcus sp.]|uniref:cobalt-factor II C(20)-methyltransferase n=1 Tax=Peptostreptococcus sp. TaxID=1262 RepID=UPI002FC87190